MVIYYNSNGKLIQCPRCLSLSLETSSLETLAELPPSSMLCLASWLVYVDSLVETYHCQAWGTCRDAAEYSWTGPTGKMRRWERHRNGTWRLEAIFSLYVVLLWSLFKSFMVYCPLGMLLVLFFGQGSCFWGFVPFWTWGTLKRDFCLQALKHWL